MRASFVNGTPVKFKSSLTELQKADELAATFHSNKQNAYFYKTEAENASKKLDLFMQMQKQNQMTV